MIDRLQGTLLTIEPGVVVVDVGGVGFRVEVTAQTAALIGPVGNQVTLLTTFLFVGSQDAQPRLFGFATPEARALFRLLRNVSGIGPSTALRLLGSGPSAADVAAAIAREDTRAIRVKGVGPKIAKRVVTELKDRVAEVLSCIPEASVAARSTVRDPALEEAFLALRGLEFDPQRARTLLDAVRSEMVDAGANELVRAVLIRS